MTTRNGSQAHIERAAFSLHSTTGARKYINALERRLFIDAAIDHDPATRALCLVLVYTGCRLSEALQITEDAMQPGQNILSIRSMKKRRKGVIREVPVPATLLVAIDAVTNPTGKKNSIRDTRLIWPWRRTWAWSRVKSVMRAAGIHGVQASPKGLRHGFGVHAVQSGIPLNLVQKWLGHAQLSTTAIYVNAVGPEEYAIASRMWTRDDQVK